MLGGLEKLDMGDVGVGFSLFRYGLDGVPVLFEERDVDRGDDQAQL